MPMPPDCPETCMTNPRFRISGVHELAIFSCAFHVPLKLNSMINYDGPAVMVTRVRG